MQGVRAWVRDYSVGGGCCRASVTTRSICAAFAAGSNCGGGTSCFAWVDRGTGRCRCDEGFTGEVAGTGKHLVQARHSESGIHGRENLTDLD